MVVVGGDADWERGTSEAGSMTKKMEREKKRERYESEEMRQPNE